MSFLFAIENLILLLYNDNINIFGGVKMSIFKEGSSHGYDASMSILFNDINGRLDDNKARQYCWDFYELGAGYLKNAEISLSYLLEGGPDNNQSSSMIFPILFSIWHGLELMLKSGNMVCDILLGETGNKYTKHTIDVYSDQFREKLKRLGFETVEEDHLLGMIQFIDDCKEKNAHFDFARYSNQSNGEKQFYNTPNKEGVVENTYVDMIELAKVLTLINYGLTNTVGYLVENNLFHGPECKNTISDFGLKMYIEHSSFARFVGDGSTMELKEIIENLKNELKEKNIQEKPKEKE